MAKQERKVASVSAESLVQRGLMSDRDVEFTDCRWVSFDYVKKDGSKVVIEDQPVGFEATLVALDDATIVETSRWKIGDTRFFDPDGKTLYVVGEGDGAASKSSNWGIFIQALADIGLPKAIQDSLGADATLLNGLKGHLVRRKVERGGTDQSGKEIKSNEIPVLSSIIALPGQKSGGKKPSGKSAAKARSAPANSDDGDISASDVAEYVLTALGQAEDDIDLADLPAAAMLVMITEQVAKDRRVALRDWIRDQGEELEIEGVLFANGKFSTVE